MISQRLLLLLLLMSDITHFVCSSISSKQDEDFFDFDDERAPTPDASADDPYKSSSFVGHSLWLIPGGSSKDAYEGIVAETASELSTFSFKPHITLVAAIMTDVQDVVQRTKALAKQLEPYEFEFDTVSQKDAYFQCVFAKYKKTQQVMDANTLAREYFPEKKTDPEYMPHLSLIYGFFTHEEKESKLIPDLEQKIAKRAPATTSVSVDSIEVWSTQGNVKDWYLVERVPISGGYQKEIDEETCQNNALKQTSSVGLITRFRKRLRRVLVRILHFFSVTGPSK